MPSQQQVSFESITSLVYERKFDTALRKTTYNDFQKRLIDNRLTLDDKLITTSNHTKSLEDAKCDSRLYCMILQSILKDSESGHLYSPKKSKAYQRIPNISNETIDIQWEYMNHHNTLLEIKHNRLMRINWAARQTITPTVQNLMTIGNTMSFIVDKSNRIKDFKYRHQPDNIQLEEKQKINHYTLECLNLTLVWSEKLLYVSYKNSTYLLPISYLLLIYKLHDLISILVYAQGAAGNALPSNAVDVTLEFINELIIMHKEFKDNYYGIAKTLESLCVAESLMEMEDWKNNEFLIALNNELSNELDFDYLRSNLRYILISVPVPFRHELCCLSNLLGHPFVDMQEGSYDLFQKVQEPLMIDMIKVTECINYIKENYIRNHILRHGKWPPCTIDPSIAPKALIMAHALNKDPNAQDIKRKYGHDQSLLLCQFITQYEILETRKLHIIP